MKVKTIAGELSALDVTLVIIATSIAILFFPLGWIASQIWTGLIAGWITGEKFGEKISERP